ncbi:MAG: cobalt-precorrin 5A hydrolase [Desulfobacterales bacterium]
MNKHRKKSTVAVWAVTPAGSRIAAQIAGHLNGAVVHTGPNAGEIPGGKRFDRLAQAVEEIFAAHDAHVFVMAAGIAVRMIAPLITSKQTDPAVVTVDDTGAFAVSLLSGHMGGANALAAQVADIIGARTVITTATDRGGIPAVDLLAAESGLGIENPTAVRAVSMALIAGQPVLRYDPYGVLEPSLGPWTQTIQTPDFKNQPGIYVCHETADLPENVLVLRTASLAVGVGCNSGTPGAELCSAVDAVFARHGLAFASIRHLATISEKISEPGMQELASYLKCPLKSFTRAELETVKNIPTPSAMVEKHMGVKSVCEAAAILAARTGPITVPKQRIGNTTVAVAALPSLS